MGLRNSVLLETPQVVFGEKCITFGCKNCSTHLSQSKQVISDKYRGRLGNAFLVNKVVNILRGQAERRHMTTGLYMVCDIKCHQCKKVIGWEYLSADDDTQQFKVGKFILEANGIIYVQ